MSTTDEIYAPRWVRASECPGWQANEIVPGLFMGGTHDGDTIEVPRGRYAAAPGTDGFDAVVTLYAWARPAGWNVVEHRYGFGDGALDPGQVEHVVEAARWAHGRWTAGSKVLIRCQAGLNRSGLVTALVLMLDGSSAAEAIALLRANRSPWALCNDAFVTWLLEEAPDVLAAQARGHGTRTGATTNHEKGAA